MRTPIAKARDEDRDAREHEGLAAAPTNAKPCFGKRLRRRCAASGALAVDRKLFLHHRQRKQCREKRTPRTPCWPTEELGEHLRVVERAEDVHLLCSRA